MGTSPMERVGRPVTITSLGFTPDKTEAEIAAVVEAEARKGPDLIALPECWLGSRVDALDGAPLRTLSAIARKWQVYIVSPIYRCDGERVLNSAVLLGRDGNIAMVYDKAYPFWCEMAAYQGIGAVPGAEVPVFAADFGRLGLATCFDVNFPNVWQLLAEKGAEVVLWVSAYSAGRSLQAHAINHHYYIVSATSARDCQVYDITGARLHYSRSGRINIATVTLDLDRCLFHYDFNIDKRTRLLAEHGAEVELEEDLPQESWFVLRAKQSGVSARRLAAEYGIEELRAYKLRSQREIDAMRGEALR